MRIPNAVDVVYALNTGMLRSVDGGKTFNLVNATHGDHHALWIDPNNSNSLINANDGGASISLDGGNTWSTQDNQPTGQFYHVATDDSVSVLPCTARSRTIPILPSRVSMMRESSGRATGIRPAAASQVLWFLHPHDPEIIYSDAENQYARFDHRSEQSQNISPDPIDNSGHPADELQHRFNWTAPLMISGLDPTGSLRGFRSAVEIDGSRHELDRSSVLI